MKTSKSIHLLSFILCLVLFATLTLVTGCSDNTTSSSSVASTGGVESPTDVVTQVGEGPTQFQFQVVDQNGKTTAYLIRTSQTVVGDALQELGLIAGEEGQYGLYVKTVNGITLDYDTHGMYWAFYENDQYALAGVDTTTIDTSVVYSFRAGK